MERVSKNGVEWRKLNSNSTRLHVMALKLTNLAGCVCFWHRCKCKCIKSELGGVMGEGMGTGVRDMVHTDDIGPRAETGSELGPGLASRRSPAISFC